MSLSVSEGSDLERHVVDQKSIVVSQSFFVAGEYELVEVAAELMDEPLMLALDTAWRAYRSCEKNDIPQTPKFGVESLEPLIGDKIRPEICCLHVRVSKEFDRCFTYERFWK